MKMQKDDHFAVARLVECVLNVIVQNVNLVTTNTGILEPIGMRF